MYLGLFLVLILILCLGLILGLGLGLDLGLGLCLCLDLVLGLGLFLVLFLVNLKMKMIQRIQNSCWSDFNWLKSRSSRRSHVSSSNGHWYRCKSWRYFMQWSNWGYSSPHWSSIEE